MTKEEKKITLADHLRILLRRKWLIAWTLISFLGAATVFSLVATPTYEAATTMMIEKEGGVEDHIFSVSDFVKKDVAIKTQVEILRSRTLAESVIDAILVSRERRAFQDMMAGKNGVLPTRARMAESLQSNMKVTPIRDTDIIEVKVVAKGPRMAALLANTVADQYRQHSLRLSRGEITEVREFLQEQSRIVQDSLRLAEEELKNYMQEEKVSALPEETAELVKQLATFESMLNEARIELEAEQKRLDHMKKQLSQRKSQLLEEITQTSTPMIAKLREEITELEAMRAEYVAQGVEETHPKMQQILTRIRETKAKLIEETNQLVSRELTLKDPLGYSQDLVSRILAREIEMQSLSAKAEALRRIVYRYSRRMNRLPEKSLKLARLQRSAKVGENIYLMLMEKYEEARIKEAGQIGNVRIVDKAIAPDEPVRPDMKLNLLLAALLGLLVGGGTALFLESLDSSLKSIDDIEDQGLSVLGYVPKIKSAKAVGRSAAEPDRTREKEVRKVASHLITHFAPKSPVSEAYRTLRTNIQFTNLDSPPKTMLVTSPGPGEGKSTTVANLAITFAQMGTKTLLMDADFRRPILHSIFGLQKELGITDYLAGKASLETVVKKKPIQNLDIITCGVIPPNPSELLASERMKDFLEQLKAEYQMILFDTPPVIAVTDAAVLSLLLDGVVLLASARQTSQQALARAKSLLQNVNARILGVVLNKMETRSSYGSYYYYYSYHHHGHQERPKKIKRRVRKPARRLEPVNDWQPVEHF